mmetsp:Transcript_23246/g.41294  ORF Transcript_23246/g.41294 Transcript_23246/m.41294 type:complete len:253 (+) Transcript_23246:101-859(+)
MPHTKQGRRRVPLSSKTGCHKHTRAPYRHNALLRWLRPRTHDSLNPRVLAARIAHLLHEHRLLLLPVRPRQVHVRHEQSDQGLVDRVLAHHVQYRRLFVLGHENPLHAFHRRRERLGVGIQKQSKLFRRLVQHHILFLGRLILRLVRLLQQVLKELRSHLRLAPRALVLHFVEFGVEEILRQPGGVVPRHHPRRTHREQLSPLLLPQRLGLLLLLLLHVGLLLPLPPTDQALLNLPEQIVWVVGELQGVALL